MKLIEALSRCMTARCNADCAQPASLRSFRLSQIDCAQLLNADEGFVRNGSLDVGVHICIVTVRRLPHAELSCA